jgi:AcrR family transcriptional regulator
VTRDRIIDAALRTVREEGLVRTSVRQIARTGGFNQALIFYHFGSVEELLLAALERANERRMERFGDRLASVHSLEELVKVAADLHRSDNAAECNHSALSAIVAGWASNSEHGPKILEILRSWDELVAGALRRSLAGTPFAPLVPCDQMAHAISALFLGIELLNRLEGDDRNTLALLASLEGAAGLAGPILQSAAARPVAD